MKPKLWDIVTMCANFEQSRLTLISKPAPLSQAEALKMKTKTRKRNKKMTFTVRELFVHKIPNLSISISVPDERWFPMATSSSVYPCY